MKQLLIMNAGWLIAIAALLAAAIPLGKLAREHEQEEKRKHHQVGL
jgi:predicted tellurium resistance membrane protein TerC